MAPRKAPQASLPDPLPQFVVTRPTGTLDTFASPRPGRPFVITFETEEFTCLCPLTGQPDFAKLKIQYQPDRLCVESKSLKLYLWSFRDQGAFHEAVTNQILDDLVAATQPQWMRVEGDFLIRGGIRTLVVAEHGLKK
ncbi:MAG: NADPH-dependent 7-cyano-7-deazaguanine reductase QueF [Acidobacteriota bacterium]|nr:NADPH-dependent 7-cyano-7-deazaguanine reductase QueF [Acidobacteriota bacterium]